MNKEPHVSIILVNYNGYDDLVECIKSIEHISYSNYNIISVDNGSTQCIDSKTELWLHKHCDWIANRQNIGFSGANNIGIKYAIDKYGSKYFLLLNNDTVVTRDFLSVLVRTAESEPNVGIVCGKILWYDYPDEIWFGGGIFSEKNGMPDHIGWKQKDIDKLDYVRTITFSTGCLQLIPYQVLMDIGLLDESFFLYAEDTEFSRRVVRNGYKILYCNNSVIYHKVSRATKKNGKAQQYYMIRNNLFIIKQFSTHPFYAILRYTRKNLKELLKGQLDLCYVCKAYWHWIKNRKGRL